MPCTRSLLHTTDRYVNPIQSRNFKDARTGNAKHDYVKDFIISSNRPGSFNNGSYNATLPQSGWDLVDLERTRGLVLPSSYNQLKDKGINVRRDGGSKVSVVLPNDLIARELVNRDNQLDPEIVKLLTKAA